MTTRTIKWLQEKRFPQSLFDQVLLFNLFQRHRMDIVKNLIGVYSSLAMIGVHSCPNDLLMSIMRNFGIMQEASK